MSTADPTIVVPPVGIVDEHAGVLVRVPRPADAQRLFELSNDPDEVRFGRPAFVPSYPDLPATRTSIAQLRTQHQAGRPAGDSIGACAWALPTSAMP